MDLKELEQAVDDVSKAEKMYPSKSMRLLLETCQLLLNSPSLVRDKVCDDKSLTCREEQSCGCVNEAWNACNEANRIAHVKWLVERLEENKVCEQIYKSISASWTIHKEDVGRELRVIPANRETVLLAIKQIVRQHFERR
jgi:hypothetical protein